MPRKYVKKGLSAESREKQLRAFRHNSYLGYASMMYKNALIIINSDTATDEARDTAASIMALSSELYKQLKTRVDP